MLNSICFEVDSVVIRDLRVTARHDGNSSVTKRLRRIFVCLRSPRKADVWWTWLRERTLALLMSTT
jgi:hypothetical protein